MTVKTINAIKSAEQKVYSRYGISGRQLTELLWMYAAEINNEYNGRELPEMYFGFMTVQAALARYCRWVGEQNQASPIAPSPDDLNKTLPFISIRPEELPEREDLGE